jgi:GNAT superfamily N-acetyltransferase
MSLKWPISYHFGLEQFDFAAIHDWLTHSYWSPGISREKVEKGFANSTVCVGAFAGDAQIGVARVISDTTRFAYVCDVFVQESFRGQGVARAMVTQLIEYPVLREVNSWYLLTKDAQPVYAGLGFIEFPDPERFMVWRR